MDLIRYFEPDDLEYFKYIRYIEEGKTKNEKINVYESSFKNNIGREYTKSTFDFAELINIELPKVKTHIPVYREDSKEFLFALAKKGLEKRLNGNVPEIYKERLMYELSVIEKMNSSSDPRSNLLQSLKPYLREEKRGKLDQYSKILNMTSIMELLNQNNDNKENPSDK